RGRAVNDGRRCPSWSATKERRYGPHVPPWQVPVPARVERLSSSNSRNPRSHADRRSVISTPEQGHTVPSLGQRGSFGDMAAPPTVSIWGPPTIRARVARG